MGWLSDLGDAISNAADKVADAVEGAVDAVTEAVAGAVESVGNAAADAVGSFAGAVTKIPGIGPLLGPILGRVGQIVAGFTQVVATSVRAVVNLATGLFAEPLRIVGGGIGGLLSGNFDVAQKGLRSLGERALGAVLAPLGATAGLVQTAIGLQRRARPLTESERGRLSNVYRQSLALGNIRIIEGQAGLFSSNDRPFTLGNHIYAKDADLAADFGVLVHECAHVWQYQHEGTQYIGGALIAQWTLHNAYDWKVELNAGKSWLAFNKEAQAEFIEDVFKLGAGAAGIAGAGAFYEDDPIGPAVLFQPSGSADLTAFARASVNAMRTA